MNGTEEEIALKRKATLETYKCADGFIKTIRILDSYGNVVLTYTQSIEFGDKLTDDDLSFAQEAMDNAQKVFIQSMKGTY